MNRIDRDLSYQCEIGGRTVCLDPITSRYYLLPQQPNGRCKPSVESNSVVRRRTLQRAISVEVLSRLQSATRPTWTKYSPQLMWDTLRLLVERVAAGIEVRRCPIGRVFKRLRCAHSRSLATLDREEALMRTLRALEVSSLLMQTHNRCLPTSLAVCRFLARLGVDASLHLGVRLDPFMAHAWVQVDDQVVLDDPDLVAHYTQIAAL